MIERIPPYGSREEEGPEGRRYVLRRRATGPQLCVVETPGQADRILEHRKHHSENIEWGYGGSGPTDLARSIVADVTGEEEPAPVVYQAVKWELVAPLPESGGVVLERDVRRIIQRVHDQGTAPSPNGGTT